MSDLGSVTVAALLGAIGANLEHGPPSALGGRLVRLVDASMLTAANAEGSLCVMSASEVVGGPPASQPTLLVVPTTTTWVADYDGAVARVPDARLALAHASAHFVSPHLPAVGVDERASVHHSATLGAGVRVAAYAVIGAGAVLGQDCAVGAGSVIGEGVTLGAGCRLYPNVTIYPGVVFGDRVVVHAGSVIGADGFGYAAGPAGAVKVHHVGGVRLEDDVEVGANTCIDRGTLQDTVVGARTKIDNHCQVGHNVQIGHDTLIAGMAAIAGSVKIGSGVIIGGAVGISDHVTIGDGARLAGRSGVTKSVPAGATWAGFPARPHREFVRELYLLGKLEDLWRRAKAGARGEEREGSTEE